MGKDRGRVQRGGVRMAATGGRRRGGGVRVTSMGRDLVLAVGLVGICLGGAAVFVKAAVETGGGVPVLPVVTVLLLAAGVALARWSISPGLRRSTACPPSPRGPMGPGAPQIRRFPGGRTADHEPARGGFERPRPHDRGRGRLRAHGRSAVRSGWLPAGGSGRWCWGLGSRCDRHDGGRAACGHPVQALR